MSQEVTCKPQLKVGSFKPMDSEAKNGFRLELEKVIEVQSSTGFADMKNNKIEDSEATDNDHEKIFEAQSSFMKEKEKLKMIAKLLLSIAVLHITLGVLAMVLNIIFIYDGMNSGWYFFKDSLGTELKVISIGEDIMIGLFFIIIASAAAIVLSKKGVSKCILCPLYILLAVFSFMMIITTGCQIGLIHQYFPDDDLPSSNQELQLQILKDEENRQTAVVAVRMVLHFFVFASSIAAAIVVSSV